MNTPKKFNKRQLSSIRSYLDRLNRKIRHGKKQRKGAKYGVVEGLEQLRWDARVANLAYGLLRGHAIEKLERKHEKGHEASMQENAWGAAENAKEDFIEYWEERQQRKALPHTLYVIPNGELGLTPEQIAVQCGHAAAEFARLFPQSPWKNGRLIYLSGGDARAKSLFFQISNSRLSACGELCSYFDPDISTLAPTALACALPDGEGTFKNLPLLKFDQPKAA